jgi:hypothetical protein
MGASISHPHGRLRAGSEGSLDDLEAHGVSSILGPPLRIDVKAVGNGAPRQQKGALALAKTVITTCPLWDVIAMLILLLQLPPTIISIVHFLFAAITFMPTSATTSISNMPSIREFLAESAGGPTVPVIVFLDAVFLIIFLMLMVPLQNITLDLAQAVVAIAFSGAAASKRGPANSIFTCTAIIGLSHLLRWKPARQLGFNLFWTGLVRTGLRPIGDPPAISGYPDRLLTPPGWPRCLLGVHILTQGMVRLVRRYLLWRDALNVATTGKGKADPESGTSSTPTISRTNTSIADSNFDTVSSASTDGRPPGPSPASKDGKERVSSNRKKKKHASQVRSQQPFWAAIASTKVTFLKEYEQSQVSIDFNESKAIDISHIGNADFQGGGDRFWIKSIGSTEVCFGACLLRSDGKEQEEEEREDSDAVDTAMSRTFSVRVNGADWSSIKMQITERGITCDDGIADIWAGKIFGLTPYSPYKVEFEQLEDDMTICATNLITQPAPSAEQGMCSHKVTYLLSSDNLPVTVVSTPSQSLLPSSPTTTLKNSVQAAEQQLESQRNRLKRSKKEHKTVTSGIQKEVDNLTARLNSSGGNDERQRQKIRQLEQSIRRAEDAAADLEKQITDFGDVPANELEEASAKKAAWRQEKEHHTAMKREFEACKAEADRELAQVQSELASAQQKHQRFQQRQAKYNEQYESLVSATNQGHEAQARRFMDWEAQITQRAHDEQMLLKHIEHDRRQAQELLTRAVQADAQARHLQELYIRSTSQLSIPPTPEGPLPGTRGSVGNSQLQSPYSTIQFSTVGPSQADSTSSMNNINRIGRGRSSSMLSNISNFTDNLEEQLSSATSTSAVPSGILNGNGNVNPPLPLWSRRKSSQGSGSASGTGSAPGSNNSSQRDPMSPAPKILSPTIGVLGSPISPPPPQGLPQRQNSSDGS